MIKIFFRKKKRSEDELKQTLHKKVFNASSHKKMIVYAAKKSAEDQRKMLARYDKIISQ